MLLNVFCQNAQVSRSRLMRLINYTHVMSVYLPAFWIIALAYFAYSVLSHHPKIVEVNVFTPRYYDICLLSIFFTGGNCFHHWQDCSR
jgi:hypothetical protein